MRKNVRQILDFFLCLNMDQYLRKNTTIAVRTQTSAHATVLSPKMYSYDLFLESSSYIIYMGPPKGAFRNYVIMEGEGLARYYLFNLGFKNTTF